MNSVSEGRRSPQVNRKPPFRVRVLRTLGLRDLYTDLSSILSNGPQANDLADKIRWLALLITWIRGPVLTSGPQQAVVRFRFLLQILERHENHRQLVSSVLSDILQDTEAPSLFAQTELTEQGGVLSEVIRRSADFILPPPPRPHELAYAVRIAFTGEHDDEWLAAIPDEEWLRACELLSVSANSQILDKATRLESDLQDAVLNLAMSAAALSFAPDVRERMRSSRLGDGGAPFVVMSRLAFRWRDGLAQNQAMELTLILRDSITAAHAAVAEAYRGVEEHGVSLSLVYRLETISGLLRRMELILGILSGELSHADRRLGARDLLVELVRTTLAHRSLRALLDMNFDIFARRLVQSAGETGEHYITRTRKEYLHMFWEGAGGGLVSVPMTLLKFVIMYFHLPLFFGGLFVWINYSASFLAMQFLGFTLATKQPSMTAAALAGKLSGAMNRTQIFEFVEMVARISRSQFAAAVGNVGLVIPGAWVANFVYEKVIGHPVISVAYAEKTLLSFHPWKSGSLFYAAVTGVLLWLSSFGAGWLENWVIYRGLDESIAGSRTLRSLLGEKKARDLGTWTREHASGIGGNVAIGFLLAFVPVAGSFFGLPLDIRHVTLSAGAMTFAFCAIGASALTWQTVTAACVGVALIGIMNFTVSTACALIVAARAQKVRRSWFRAFLNGTWILFTRSPLQFFFPPADRAVVAASTSGSGVTTALEAATAGELANDQIQQSKTGSSDSESTER